MNIKQIKKGSTIIYNDGRPGHTGSKAAVLEVTKQAMVVQFTDRADTTAIRFDNAGWMNYITLASKETKFTFREGKHLPGECVVNGERAERGAAMVGAYSDLSGMPSTDDPCCVQDLISDLLHYADREGMDTSAMLDSARNRWEEER
jgi:hypothetical protein